jgi:hypothetical protein
MDLRHRAPIVLSLIAAVFTGSMVVAEEANHRAHDAAAGEPASQQQAADCPMMGQRMMGGGMMRTMGQEERGMMGMGPGRMKGSTAHGMASVFGSRVTPMMNLSVEDVQVYLAAQLDRLKNKRLKVGDTKIDAETITADIVTADNSLVQRLKVDRHTGAIEYQD